MSEVNTHSCPICSESTPHQNRYPLSVCFECYGQAKDIAGRKLTFYNIDLSGGYKAIIEETGEEYESHICYINGVKCYADEAKFGGIVIQIVKQ